MAEFTNLRFGPMPAMRPLLVGKRETELLEPLLVHWHGEPYFLGRERDEAAANGARLIVPAGFIHDGPSTPGRLRGVVVYTHRQLRAAVVHDWLYANAPEGWTRKMADDLFLVMLEADGVGWLKRQTMYRAVRVGGRSSWKGKT